jgi:hypothetical protein
MPNNNHKDTLAKYLKKFLAKGYSADVLKSYLVKKGYSESTIDSSLKQARGPLHIHIPKTKRELIPIIGIGFVIIIAFIIISVIPTTEGCGYDKACFIAKANNCEESVVREDLQGSTILYKSSNDCVITKSFEEFSESEPEEIKLLFGNKDMACTYEKNNLNEDFVSLVGGIEFCDGELKDSIYELRLAQIALS